MAVGASSGKPQIHIPKCFNIASRVQKGSTDQPLTCRVHPLAALKILDAFVRRPDNAKRVIGTLLGWISEGGVVDITDSYAVVHKDTTDTVLMDQDYHNSMLQLRQKVSEREVVVGWFSTGNEITATSAVIHAFYCTQESQFNPTAALPGPIHLLVHTDLSEANVASSGLKAFVNVRTAVADNLLQFHEIPLTVKTSQAEKSGISQLLHARNATREAFETGTAPKDISSMDGFEGGLKELLGLFHQMQKYVKDVKAGKVEPDKTAGRELTTALCGEPVLNVEAVEDLCNNSLQDALMIVYLSNLTRTQIAIAEKINSIYTVSNDS